MVVWLALLPQVITRLAGSAGEEESDPETDNETYAPAGPTAKSTKREDSLSPSPSDLLLRIGELTVATTGGREILRQLKFNLPRGKVVVVVGESGSGKSTLINCILNLLPEGLEVTAGTVLYDCKKVTYLLQLSDGERRLLAQQAFGYVPQDARSALDPLAKAYDIVSEAAALAPSLTPGQNDRVQSAYFAAGLPEDFLRNDAIRRRGQLSGGQCQRVAIAQAIVNEPDLLLMDEPTSSLDPLGRKGLLSTIKALTVNGRTVLLVTHDIGSIADVADWVAVMYLGKVVESGPALQILNTPKHPYTKALLRCVPRVDVRFPIAVIRGQVANNAASIPGCKFHPRCSECLDPCRTEEPETRAIADSVEVACHVAQV